MPTVPSPGRVNVSPAVQQAYQVREVNSTPHLNLDEFASSVMGTTLRNRERDQQVKVNQRIADQNTARNDLEIKYNNDVKAAGSVEEADKLLEKYQNDQATLAAKATDGLSTEYEINSWNNWHNVDAEHRRTRAIEFADKRKEDINVQSSNTIVESTDAAYMAHPNEESLNQAITAKKNLYSVLHLSDKQKELQLPLDISRLHGQAVDTFLANEDPAGADAYLTKHKDSIDAKSFGDLSRRADAALIAKNGREAGDMIFNFSKANDPDGRIYVDEKRALEQINALEGKTPEQTDKLRKIASSQFYAAAEREKSANEQQGRIVYNNKFDQLEAGKITFEEITTPEIQAMTAEQARALRVFSVKEGAKNGKFASIENNESATGALRYTISNLPPSERNTASARLHELLGTTFPGTKNTYADMLTKEGFTELQNFATKVKQGGSLTSETELKRVVASIAPDKVSLEDDTTYQTWAKNHPNVMNALRHIGDGLPDETRFQVLSQKAPSLILADRKSHTIADALEGKYDIRSLKVDFLPTDPGYREALSVVKRNPQFQRLDADTQARWVTKQYLLDANLIPQSQNVITGTQLAAPPEDAPAESSNGFQFREDQPILRSIPRP